MGIRKDDVLLLGNRGNDLTEFEKVQWLDDGVRHSAKLQLLFSAPGL